MSDQFGYYLLSLVIAVIVAKVARLCPQWLLFMDTLLFMDMVLDTVTNRAMDKDRRMRVQTSRGDVPSDNPQMAIAPSNMGLYVSITISFVFRELSCTYLLPLPPHLPLHPLNAISNPTSITQSSDLYALFFIFQMQISNLSVCLLDISLVH